MNYIETDTGVCPFIIHPTEPDLFLGVIELQTKEKSYKLAGMMGPGFETVEVAKGETRPEAVDRFFREEVKIFSGGVIIPQDLEEAEICRVQLSPGAWVHVYPVQAYGDFEVGIGSEKREVAGPIWLSRRRVLSTMATPESIVFRPGTKEILEAMRDVYDHGLSVRGRLYSDPMQPFPRAVFDLQRTGVPTDRALSQFGIDPRPLLSFQPAARLLEPPAVPVALRQSPAVFLPSLQ